MRLIGGTMPRIQSYAAAALIIAATAVSIPLAGADRPVQADVVAAPVVTGCVIRFEPDGPAIHQNSTHRCTGANSVSVQADGDLLIRSDHHGAVISMTAEEDETLSRRGILAGPSGGVGTTVVRFYSTKTGAAVRADSDALKGTYANLWMTWVNTR